MCRKRETETTHGDDLKEQKSKRKRRGLFRPDSVIHRQGPSRDLCLGSVERLPSCLTGEALSLSLFVSLR